MSTETIRLITIRDGEKVEGGMEVGEEEVLYCYTVTTEL